MLQYLYPAGRAYKRLLYFGLLWTCVCFVAFRVASNYPRDKTLYYLMQNVQQSQRGLLQNLAAADYAVAGSTTTTTARPAGGGSGSGGRRVDLNAVPQVDNSPAPSEQDVLASLAGASNLPLAYWAKIRKNQTLKGKAQTQAQTNPKACKAEFPSLYELDYNNIYWQRFTSAKNGSTFYLYAAYFDDRWRGGPLPAVRVLAMIDRIQPPLINCQFWFDQFNAPIFAPATYVYGWYPKWGNYRDGLLQPYIITCKVPRIKGFPKVIAPDSVSIVDDRCDKATNNLRVINNRPEKKQKFAVCVKGLDFLHEDLSVRLVEWLELLRLLGASKVFLYNLETHPNITKVLEHYQRDGLVDLTHITLAGNQPNLPGELNACCSCCSLLFVFVTAAEASHAEPMFKHRVFLLVNRLSAPLLKE